MEWKQTIIRRIGESGQKLLLGCALTSMAFAAGAQTVPPGVPGINNPGTGGAVGADQFVTLGGSLISVSLGAGTNAGGSMGVFTTANNTADPSDVLLLYANLARTNNVYLASSRLYLRVDGGINGGTGGFDYEVGNPTATDGGTWLTVPQIAGNHIVARWTTVAVAPVAGTGTGNGNGGTGSGNGNGNGTGGTTTTTINPNIEVDYIISIVHNQVRFQFNVVNNDQRQHTVGLAFEECQLNNPNDASIGAPIILPGLPYVRTETLLTSGQIPAYWQYQTQLTPGSSIANPPPQIHTGRGTMRPTATSGSEPTVPSRFAVGRIDYLEGALPTKVTTSGANTGTGGQTTLPAGPSGRYFDTIWNFQPNPNIRFDQSGSPLDTIVRFYDPQPIAPGQNIPITAYSGQGQSDLDVGTPISLVVTSPDVLPYNSTPTSNAFNIGAYVTNLLDLQPGGGTGIGPTSVTLNLPAGLKLNNDTAVKTISTIAPGQEGGVLWSVVPDGTATGTLQFSVTASSNIGVGKQVFRTIQVPTSPTVTLRGTTTAKGLYQMVSFPFDFHGDTPTTILYPGQSTNLVAPDLAQFNPTTGRYDTVTTFVPGVAYWIRSRLAQDQTIPITGYSPLAGQVQSSSTTAYKVNYNLGWNQIGDPYVYSIPFSEVQIFDTSTLSISSVADATNPATQTVLPAVYYFDTSDPSSANWHYVLENGIGFQMQPFQGYFVYLKKSGLQFLYQGVDAPGASVTRAALAGVGFKNKLSTTRGVQLGRGTSDNWRLHIGGKSANGYDPDNYIGVAPGATNGPDGYKYNKPPMINRGLSVSIAHEDWKDGNEYAQDLRAPNSGMLQWDMVVRSAKPNDAVNLVWDSVSRNVPRSYNLSLIDPVTGQSINMRNASQHSILTGADGTRHVQITAEPINRQNVLQITSFEVIGNTTAQTRATRSANVQFSVLGGSADTEMQVVVSDSRGRVVRTLPTSSISKAASAGVVHGNALLDLKNQQGATLASGVYNVELRVTRSDGSTSRQMQTLTITR